MKIALCISGHFRTFEKCFNSLKLSILDITNCDVFIHSWNILEPSSSIFNCTIDLNKVISMYCPRKILIEEQISFNFIDKAREKALVKAINKAKPNDVYSMYYSIMKSNQLKTIYEQENNFKYDIVIRYRPDTVFKNKILLDIKPDYLYVNDFGTNFAWLSDVFAYGSSDVMNIYADTFNRLPELNNVVELHPEVTLKLHIVDNNNIKISKSSVECAVLRQDGRHDPYGTYTW